MSEHRSDAVARSGANSSDERSREEQSRPTSEHRSDAVAPPASRAHRTLVLGGVRSGKSWWAEQQLAGALAVDYVATAAGRDDADWAERIALHRQRRPAHWRTIECLDLAALLSRSDGRETSATSERSDRPLLIEDLGNWVARTIDASNGWDGDLGPYRAAADQLVQCWQGFTGRALLVSNEVGSGVHPESRAGRIFRDELGRLNTELAAHTEEVVLVIAGIPTWLRRHTDTDGASG